MLDFLRNTTPLTCDRYIIHDDFHVEVRATVAIRAGEEITDHYVTPLNGTGATKVNERLACSVSHSWFFLQCTGEVT